MLVQSAARLSEIHVRQAGVVSASGGDHHVVHWFRQTPKEICERIVIVRIASLERNVVVP